MSLEYGQKELLGYSSFLDHCSQSDPCVSSVVPLLLNFCMLKISIVSVILAIICLGGRGVF